MKNRNTFKIVLKKSQVYNKYIVSYNSNQNSDHQKIYKERAIFCYPCVDFSNLQTKIKNYLTKSTTILNSELYSCILFRVFF